jgi:hypothetical protein
VDGGLDKGPARSSAHADGGGEVVSHRLDKADAELFRR